jgi:hypothetical protein
VKESLCKLLGIDAYTNKSQVACLRGVDQRQ